MLKSHHDMLTAVVDFIKSTEEFVPMGDHSVIQKSWWNENYFLLLQAMEQTESKPPTQYVKDKAIRVLNLVTDAYGLFLKDALNPSWQTLTPEERRKKIHSLKTAPQIEQRTKEWYQHFAHVLTASEFSTLFGSVRQRRNLVMAKAFPKIEDSTFFRTSCPTDEMSPTGWGIRFEPVVKQILEHKFQCKIYEPGRITHPKNAKLAASADGIFEESAHKDQLGRLVEIKCPFSRAIGNEIPADYWIQMQIQMEVTDIDECEYVEVEILSRKANQAEVDLSGCSLKGKVYLLKQTVEEGKPFGYKYVYGEMGMEKPPSFPKGYTLLETIPWGFKKWHRKVVQRDKAWYASTKTWQDTFWNDVERAKKGEKLLFGGDEPLPATARCLIMDDSS